MFLSENCRAAYKCDRMGYVVTNNKYIIFFDDLLVLFLIVKKVDLIF